MRNISIEAMARATANTERLAQEIWDHAAEQAFQNGDGRLFLRIVRPLGGITFANCVDAFVNGEKTVTRLCPRFIPGEMKASAKSAFIVVDLARLLVEDVITPEGASLIDGREESTVLSDGEAAYNLIPRMNAAVHNGVKKFRVPEILLWLRASNSLDPNDLAELEDLMRQDATATVRFAQIEKSTKNVEERAKQ